MTGQIAAAEALGFESFWTAEAYGSDAFTPLAWWGAATSRIKLGTGILVLPMRNPVILAKQLACMDLLSDGRLLIRSASSRTVTGQSGQRRSLPPLPRIFTKEAPRSRSPISSWAASSARLPEL